MILAVLHLCSGAAMAGVAGASILFSIIAVSAARLLPKHMDACWRDQARAFLGEADFVPAPVGRGERPIVAGLAAMVLVLCLGRFGVGWAGFAAIAFCWCLLLLAVIDFRSTLLPDVLTLPLMWAGILVHLAWRPEAQAGVPGGLVVPLDAAMIGAMAGYCVLYAVCALFKAATGRDGMGVGDLKLVAAIGAWLGWYALPTVVSVAAIPHIVMGLYSRLTGGSAQVPLGPPLAFGTVVVLLTGFDLSTVFQALL